MKNLNKEEGSLLIEVIINIFIGSIILLILIQFLTTIIKIQKEYQLKSDFTIESEYFFNFIEREINNTDEIYILANETIFLNIENKNTEYKKNYNYFKYALKDNKIYRRATNRDKKITSEDKLNNIYFDGNNKLYEEVDEYLVDINKNEIKIILKQKLFKKEKYIKLDCKVFDLRGEKSER